MMTMMMMMTKISSSTRKLYSKNMSNLLPLDVEITYTLLRNKDFKFCKEKEIKIEEMIESNSHYTVFINKVKNIMGHAIEQLVEALGYKPEGRGFDSRWCHWNFF